MRLLGSATRCDEPAGGDLPSDSTLLCGRADPLLPPPSSSSRINTCPCVSTRLPPPVLPAACPPPFSVHSGKPRLRCRGDRTTAALCFLPPSQITADSRCSPAPPLGRPHHEPDGRTLIDDQSGISSLHTRRNGSEASSQCGSTLAERRTIIALWSLVSIEGLVSPFIVSL